MAVKTYMYETSLRVLHGGVAPSRPGFSPGVCIISPLLINKDGHGDPLHPVRGYSEPLGPFDPVACQTPVTQKSPPLHNHVLCPANVSFQLPTGIIKSENFWVVEWRFLLRKQVNFR